MHKSTSKSFKEYLAASAADDGPICMHFGSIPMHLPILVTLTVSSTMPDFTVNHAASDHDLQKMLHVLSIIYAYPLFKLEFFSRKPPHIRVGLIAYMQEMLSSLTIIFSHNSSWCTASGH